MKTPSRQLRDGVLDNGKESRLLVAVELPLVALLLLPLCHKASGLLCCFAQKAKQAYLPTLRLLLVILANHPVDAELVGKHPEIVAPESLAHRHGHFPAFGQCVKQPVGFFFAVGVDGDGEVVALLEGRRPFAAGVASHKHGFFTDGQRNVHDLVFHFLRQGWHAFLGWHVFKPADVGKLPSKYGFIKVKSFFAVAVEIEVNVYGSHIDGLISG